MLSVVLPCYNEEANLPALFGRLDVLLEAAPETEVVLVNNGSNDGSAAVFRRELDIRSGKKIRLVDVPVNMGYGHGILAGLRTCTTELLSWTHADIQSDPMDVIRALELWKLKDEKVLLIKGSRINRRPTEWVFSFSMGLLASVALGKRLKEINAQPKLFSKAFFDSIESKAPIDFSLDLYFQYMALQTGKVLEFPVVFSKRVAGEAKGGSGSSWKVRMKLIRRSVAYIFKLRKEIRVLVDS